MKQIRNPISHEQHLLEPALFDMTKCAIESNDIGQLAKSLHQIIEPITYADCFSVVLYDQEQKDASVVYSTDPSVKIIESSEPINQIESLLRKTLVGYVLKTGELQCLSKSDIDRLKQKNIIDSSTSEKSNNWLGIPLKYEQNVLGVIAIQDDKQNTDYSKHDQEMMLFVARLLTFFITSKQSTNLLDNAKKNYEQKIQHRTHQLEAVNLELSKKVDQNKKSQAIESALFQITELVITSQSLREFYRSIHRIIAQLMTAKNMYIALSSKDKKHVEIVYWSDQKDENPVKFKFNSKEENQGVTEQILTTGEIVVDNGCAFYGGDMGSESSSYLGVPLKDDNDTFGVIAIQDYSGNDCYNEVDKNILLTVARQISLAILRKKDAVSLKEAHATLENKIKERTTVLEETIKKRQSVEEKLVYDSLHDSLTGLSNRVYLLQELDKLLLKNSSSALLFLDLDRFKIINDSLGHHIGDLFLIQIAQKIKDCVRGNDFVARLGGDEFCVLMPNVDSNSLALKVCNRILKSLKQPVEVNSHSLITSASIGVRLIDENDKFSDIVMSDADVAMYKAKSEGKNGYCFFNQDIKELVTKRMAMESDLQLALENDEFFLEYQPLVNCVSDKVIGFEALLRWQHPDKGLISPFEFIPVAEETGLIVEIGEQVVNMACRTLRSFQSDPNLSNLYININTSSVQILSRTLDDFIREQLSEYRVSPKLLNVEITESILIEDYKAALNFVRELRAMEIKIYLDDFGTGFSSLSYLHKFPFDAIKLDRSFIKGLDESKKNLAIVESTSMLASNLDIDIVAEGVETKEQADIIKSMKFNTIQGYFYSKPLPIDKVADFVVNHNK